MYYVPNAHYVRMHLAFLYVLICNYYIPYTTVITNCQHCTIVIEMDRRKNR